MMTASLRRAQIPPEKFAPRFRSSQIARPVAWLKRVCFSRRDDEEKASMFAYTYPLLDIFWTMLEIFAFIVYIWLLVAIFSDIFRSDDMGGAAKMLWVLFVFIIPVIGILAYLLIRGGSMHERAAKQAQRQQEAFNSYVRQAAGPN